MDRHKLPTWLPLAVVAAGLVAVPLLFLVPRSTETVDSILEAIPFFIVAMALVLAAFSRPGAWRTAGIVLAVIVVVAPIWYPPAYFAGVRLLRDDPSIRISLEVDPEGTEPYLVHLPAPLDGEGQPALVVQGLVERHDELALAIINGSWFLSVQAQGGFNAAHTYQRATGGEYWPTAEWAEDAAPRPGPDGSVVAFTIHLIGRGWYCQGNSELAGTVRGDNVTVEGSPEWDIACV